MVCICGDSKCCCSKICICTQVICLCMPCMSIRFKLEIPPSGKVPTPTNSQQQLLSDENKSIRKCIPVLNGADINGNNYDFSAIPPSGKVPTPTSSQQQLLSDENNYNSSAIPDEPQRSEVKTDETLHPVKHTTAFFNENRVPSSSSEESDYRFAQMIQQIILRQGLRSSGSARLGDEDLRRIIDCATYTSPVERRQHEKLSYSLQKETPKVGKRSLSQSSSSHSEKADASSVKRNKLISSTSENGHKDFQKDDKNLNDLPEGSSVVHPSLSAHMTENIQLPSTSDFSAISHLPSTSQFPAISQLLSTSQLSAVSHLPSTSQLPSFLHLLPSSSRPPSPSAFQCDPNISPSNSSEYLSSENEMENNDSTYSPLGALDEIVGQRVDLEGACTSNAARDQNNRLSMKLNEEINSTKSKQTEGLNCSSLEQFQDLKYSGAYSHIIDSFNNGTTTEQTPCHSDGIETPKDVFLSQLLELSASLRLDISNAEHIVQTSEIANTLTKE